MANIFQTKTSWQRTAILSLASFTVLSGVAGIALSLSQLDKLEIYENRVGGNFQLNINIGVAKDDPETVHETRQLADRAEALLDRMGND